MFHRPRVAQGLSESIEAPELEQRSLGGLHGSPRRAGMVDPAGCPKATAGENALPCGRGRSASRGRLQ